MAPELGEESDTSIRWLGLVQDKLGLSACARPCFTVCVGIQLPHVQVATAHSHAVKSYPFSRYLVAMPVWGGAYQNIVIYVCRFVVLFNGSKCLCRRTLKFWWARMLFKPLSADYIGGGGSWKFHFTLSAEETESLLLSCISFCSSCNLINKTVPKGEGTLFLHFIFTGFPYSP